MDPFTQRMLERAKLRREKLDSQKMDLEQATVLQDNNGAGFKRKPVNSSSDKNYLDCKKEKECISTTRKSKLQKLAKFYSGNEENISLEEEEEDKKEEIEEESLENKKHFKYGRLTKLASKIKEWDDDAVQSNTFLDKESKEKKKKAEAKIEEQNKKQTNWDPGMIEKLCTQGFAFTNSQSKLVYNFNKNKEVVKGMENLSQQNIVGNDKKAKLESENKVLKKAALFECHNKEEATKRARDPAELSLAERKALFEKNISNAMFPKTHYISKTTPKFVTSRNKFEEANLILEEASQVKNDNNEKVKEKDLKVEQGIPIPPPLPASPYESKEVVEKKIGTEGGRLYPSLSNLDISEDNKSVLSEVKSQNESQNSDFYLNMTFSDLLEVNKNNPCTPPSEKSFSHSKEGQILNKMDKLLESALNELSSEEDEDSDENHLTPPKMIRSSSFEYKSANEEKNESGLLHTISFYRKQHKNSVASPGGSLLHKQEENENARVHSLEEESLLVQRKIEELIAEVNKQQTIISQASQALNLCLSTVEFSGSEEQVEGERLLLLATHKRQACLNEIQRLKIENTLRPQGETLLTEKGDVCLTNISVKLKRDALRALAAAETQLYFVCLVKCDEQVLATPVISATRENLKDLALQFSGQVKLDSLLSNFRITIEVYSLELSKGYLPHDVKYHIVNKKDKKLLTPIKNKKSESKLVKANIQSPAGPNAVRSTNFQMSGYVVFSLREVTRTQWILNKVPYISPLEGSISMVIKSELRLDEEFRGFLTMFDDISGFGAWHRRWCLLSSHFISYWKYPDDEQKKVPIGTIDLRSVITENVGLVSRDVCARLNTFLLESTRPRLSDDKNSLVLNVNENTTTIRHLLSADSKQEMLTWCKKLNTTLALLRCWKCNLND